MRKITRGRTGRLFHYQTLSPRSSKLVIFFKSFSIISTVLHILEDIFHCFVCFVRFFFYPIWHFCFVFWIMTGAAKKDRQKRKPTEHVARNEQCNLRRWSCVTNRIDTERGQAKAGKINLVVVFHVLCALWIRDPSITNPVVWLFLEYWETTGESLWLKYFQCINKKLSNWRLCV